MSVHLQHPLRRRSSVNAGRPYQIHEPPASAHSTEHSAGLHETSTPYYTSTTADDGGEPEEDEGLYPTRIPTSVRRYDTTPRQVQTQPAMKVEIHDLRQRTPRGPQLTGEYPRQHSGRPQPTRRYASPPQQQALPPPRCAQQQQEEETHEAQRPRRRHWLLYMGVGMIGVLVAWMGLSLLMNWWQEYQDDLHYGRPRTSQCDAVVGHADSPHNPSHFIAVNLNRHLEVIEIPGGDASHIRVYLGPVLFGPGEDLAPVTLTFKDVNGDGKPDLIVHFQGQTVVFINDVGQFRPAKPGDNIINL